MNLLHVLSFRSLPIGAFAFRRLTYASTEIFCIMSPMGCSCRTMGMNDLTIARNESFRASYVSIVTQLRSLGHRLNPTL